MRWSTVSHRHTGQGEHGREASPATRRERRVLLPGCGGAGCSLPVFALKSFSIDSRRAFICAATLARDLKSCSAVSQRQCEQARRSRTRHSGRYISFHGVKREPASRNITRKTQCKTARSSRRPAFHAWARVCVTSNIVAEKLFLFWPSAFPATSLHFAGREQEPPSLLSGNDTMHALRHGREIAAGVFRARAVRTPAKAVIQGQGLLAAQPRLPLAGLFTPAVPLTADSHVPAGASSAVRRLLRLATKG